MNNLRGNNVLTEYIKVIMKKQQLNINNINKQNPRHSELRMHLEYQTSEGIESAPELTFYTSQYTVNTKAVLTVLL